MEDVLLRTPHEPNSRLNFSGKTCQDFALTKVVIRRAKDGGEVIDSALWIQNADFGNFEFTYRFTLWIWEIASFLIDSLIDLRIMRFPYRFDL